MKRFLALFMAIALCALPAFAEGFTATTHRDNVVIYKSDSTDSSELGVLEKGASVNVLSFDDDWAKIEYSGGKGYVLFRNLTSDKKLFAYTVTAVNVYADGDPASDIIATIPRGAAIYIVGIDGDYWRAIGVKGDEYGYILKQRAMRNQLPESLPWSAGEGGVTSANPDIVTDSAKPLVYEGADWLGGSDIILEIITEVAPTADANEASPISAALAPGSLITAVAEKGDYYLARDISGENDLGYIPKSCLYLKNPAPLEFSHDTFDDNDDNDAYITYASRYLKRVEEIGEDKFGGVYWSDDQYKLHINIPEGMENPFSGVNEDIVVFHSVRYTLEELNRANDLVLTIFGQYGTTQLTVDVITNSLAIGMDDALGDDAKALMEVLNKLGLTQEGIYYLETVQRATTEDLDF